MISLPQGRFVFLSLSMLVVGLLTPLSASADCAECSWTKTLIGRYHTNANVCPGQNAVVCDHRWEENTASKCAAATHQDEDKLLEDCKEVQVPMNYQTKLYPPNHCGTYNAQTNTLNCATPPGWVGGAGPVEKRQGWICKGGPWLQVTSFALSQRFSLDFLLPGGPVLFARVGTNKLGDIRVEIPAALLKAAGSKLNVQENELVFDLLVWSNEPDRASFPMQKVKAFVVDQQLRILSVQIEKGAIKWKLAVSKPHLGAFHSYAVSLQGLQLKTNADRPYSVLPVTQERVHAGIDPNSVTLLAEISSDGEVLAGGAHTIGKIKIAREGENGSQRRP